MIVRIDAFMPAGKHRHRAGRQRGAMRRRIDAARQPGDDAEAGGAQIARQALCEFDAGGRGIARTTNGDQRLRQQLGLAAHGEQRRRIVNCLEPRRIVRFTKGDKRDAARAAGFQFSFGFVDRADMCA